MDGRAARSAAFGVLCLATAGAATPLWQDAGHSGWQLGLAVTLTTISVASAIVAFTTLSRGGPGAAKPIAPGPTTHIASADNHSRVEVIGDVVGGDKSVET
jgi:hypothetical protein